MPENRKDTLVMFNLKLQAQTNVSEMQIRLGGKADNIFFYCQLFGVHVCHILYSSNHIQCINSWDIAHQIVGGPPIPKNVPPANFLVYQYCVKKYMFGDSGYLCSEKANKSVLADSRSIKF